MLYSDRIPVTAAELATIDPEITEIATQDSLDITTGSDSLIRRGAEVFLDKILSASRSFGGHRGGNGLGSAHLAAVHNTGLSYGNSIGTIAPQNIVVSGSTARQWSRVKLGLARAVLATCYRSALNRSVSDRNTAKYNEADAAMREVLRDLGMNGIPIQEWPLSQPAADMEEGGTWGAANLTAAVGVATQTETIDVVITYVNLGTYVSSTNPNNGESHPSESAAVVVESGEVVEIDISTLVPPTGTAFIQRESNSYVTPLAATGWNVYAAVTGSPLKLQNGSPIPIATTTWTASGNITTTGKTVLQGQAPSSNFYLNFHSVRRS